MQLYMYAMHNIVPSPITFQRRVQGPYNLRNQEPLVVPRVRSNQSKRFIPVRGANYWNSLPENIRSSRTAYMF